MGRRPRRSLLASTAGKGRENKEKLEFFRLNSMVEVSSDEEGFKGAWYVAKILKVNPPKSKGKFLIQYRNLVSDDNPDELLTETVNSSFIRPLPPPPDADQTYQLYDIVDAFHRDGWWKGFVSKIHNLKEETTSRRYTVVFENPREKFDFCSEDLRFHFDWIDGKWVQPQKQKSEEQSTNANNVATQTEIAAVFRRSKLTKHHKKEISSYKRLCDIMAPSKETSSVMNSERNTLSIQKESEQHNVSKCIANEIKSRDCASKEAEISCMDENTDPHKVAKHPKVVVAVTGSSAEKCRNGEKSSSKSMHDGTTHSKDKSSVKMIKNISLDIQKESNVFGHRDKGEQQNVSNGTTREMKSDECASKKAEISCRNENTGSTLARHQNVERFYYKRMRDGTARSKEKSAVKKSKSSPLDIQKESEQLNENTTSETESQPCASKEAEISCRNENADPDKVAKHPTLVAAATGTTKYHNGEKSSRKRMHGITRFRDKSSAEKSVLDIQKESNAFGLKDKGEQENISKGTTSEMAGDCASKVAEISCRMENTVASDIASSATKNHNGEKSSCKLMCDGLAHSKDQSSASKEADISSRMENAGEEGHVENCNQSPALTVEADRDPVKEKQELPFTKSLPFWTHVDSLDVFRLMPQNPHFKPLFECNEALREGFAISHMLNFSSLVERTSNLRADEPIQVFENHLEDLAELESFGFDAMALVDRTRNLLAIRNSQEQLNKELEDVQSKIKQQNIQKEEVEKEIEDIDQKISELEKKRAVKLSQKADPELNLQEDATRISEEISKVEVDFETLASATW